MKWNLFCAITGAVQATSAAALLPTSGQPLNPLIMVILMLSTIQLIVGIARLWLDLKRHDAAQSELRKERHGWGRGYQP